tara:strand:- start:1797 stop:2135 length:339 start_codon:yes stop_codon:yes gene_type:complete
MVILKKIKASTLMETLVASVLIVVVFMISSMILNNLFSNTIKSNTRAIEAHINELQYLYINEKLTLPYYDDLDKWNIEVKAFKEHNMSKVLFEAANTETNKNYLKEIHANEQ